MRNFGGKILTRFKEESTFLKQLFNEKLAGQVPQVRFVIVCSIRTGSTMLQNLINSHPNARCFFELFHRHQSRISFGIRGYSRRSTNSRLIRQRNEDPVAFVEKYIFGRHPSDIHAVGFKLLYSQCRRGAQFWDDPRFGFWWQKVGKEPKWEKGDRDLWKYLVENKISIIHLTRGNLLAGKVSAIIAQDTGKWGVGATGGISNQQFKNKIYIDPNEFQIDLEGEERFRAETRQLFKANPVLEITYEELINIGQPTCSNLLNFLNLPENPLTTPTIKLSNYALSEILENYSELKGIHDRIYLKNIADNLSDFAV